MAAIGFKSSPVALGAVRDLGLDRPFDWFSSERVDLGCEVVQQPARDVRGQRDGLSTGKAAREVSHNVVASRDAPVVARASWRSGQLGFVDRGGVTRRGISCKRRADSDPEL